MQKIESKSSGRVVSALNLELFLRLGKSLLTFKLIISRILVSLIEIKTFLYRKHDDSFGKILT